MTTTSTIRMTDLSRQRHYETGLDGILTPRHTVGQAIDLFIEINDIPRHEHRWVAVSRGRLLDAKTLLSDLPDADGDVRVVPAVTAGAA